MLNVETIRSIRGRGWGGGGGGVWRRGKRIHYTGYDGCVRTRMTPASEAVMGRDESHFNVSVNHSEGLT